MTAAIRFTQSVAGPVQFSSFADEFGWHWAASTKLCVWTMEQFEMVSVFRAKKEPGGVHSVHRIRSGCVVMLSTVICATREPRAICRMDDQ
jgi:hypothetical protein